MVGGLIDVVGETERDVRVKLVLCEGKCCLRWVVVGGAEDARLLKCSLGNRRQQALADFTDTFVKAMGVSYKGFHRETLPVTGKEMSQ
jgi:hypothetical protein